MFRLCPKLSRLYILIKHCKQNFYYSETNWIFSKTFTKWKLSLILLNSFRWSFGWVNYFVIEGNSVLDCGFDGMISNQPRWLSVSESTQNCTWSLQATPGFDIKVTFYRFHLEWYNASVTVSNLESACSNLQWLAGSSKSNPIEQY